MYMKFCNSFFSFLCLFAALFISFGFLIFVAIVNVLMYLFSFISLFIYLFIYLTPQQLEDGTGKDLPDLVT